MQFRYCLPAACSTIWKAARLRQGADVVGLNFATRLLHVRKKTDFATTTGAEAATAAAAAAVPPSDFPHTL